LSSIILDAEPNTVGTPIAGVTAVVREVVARSPSRAALASDAAARHDIFGGEADATAVGAAARRVARIARVVVALLAVSLALNARDAAAEDVSRCGDRRSRGLGDGGEGRLRGRHAGAGAVLPAVTRGVTLLAYLARGTRCDPEAAWLALASDERSAQERQEEG